MKVLESPVRSSPPALPARVEVEVDEAGARRSLREQIARLERGLAAAAASAFPSPLVDVPRRSATGPRTLTLGELEEARDELAVRLATARAELTRRDEFHERNRQLLERMTLEPARHKFVRVSREDVGETGCGGWEVRPHLGLLGMLAGWWRVKLSSGCPLASRQVAAAVRRSRSPRIGGNEPPAAAIAYYRSPRASRASAFSS